MDLRFSEAEQQFQSEVRTFLRDHLPRGLAEKVRKGVYLTRAEMQQWHAILNDRGWLAPHWPVQWGGPGWNTVQRFIFDTEAALAGAPRTVPFGINMLGPVLLQYGSDSQRRHWLPRILDGSDWWCQGFSEPGAGSDLAALKCVATKRGDCYVVNGQKTWTTLGHFANRMFCLVRTAATVKRQDGISFLLVDLESSGVDVRPIVLLDGHHEVNEVFFSDVRVPAENLVGEENRGWTCAKYLLSYERTNIAGIGASLAALQWLQHLVTRADGARPPLIENPHFAARLARVEIALENLKTTNLRSLAAAEHGVNDSTTSSMLKILGTEVRQEIASLARRALGPEAQPLLPIILEDDPSGTRAGASPAAQYFNLRKLSIFGGTNEIQRDIIAKALLGF